MLPNHPVTIPFGSQQVTAAFEATGSSDPDVLFGRKEELLDGARSMSRAATAQIIGGLALSLTIVGAVVGVPTIRRGLAARKNIAESKHVVECAYREYLAKIARKRINLSA